MHLVDLSSELFKLAEDEIKKTHLTENVLGISKLDARDLKGQEEVKLEISDKFKDQQLNYLQSYLPQEIVQCSNFKESVFASIEELIELSTLQVCEVRKKGLGLSCDASDLAERTLKTASGGEFIAGARFKNLDTSFPFIEVQLGAEITPEIAIEIGAVVKDEFKNLSPKGLKFKDRPHAYPTFAKWSHTVFGKIEKQEQLKVPQGMTLSFSDNLEWHDQYVAEYKERLAEKKELDGFVRIGQFEEFKESVEDHALLVGTDANGFCGVISGIKSPVYGLPAIYMIESYLSKRWIGKKIAPIAHAFFLNEMAKRFNFVWGTIYDRNLSSLNTALRIGRRVIETEYFMRFDS